MLYFVKLGALVPLITMLLLSSGVRSEESCRKPLAEHDNYGSDYRRAASVLENDLARGDCELRAYMTGSPSHGKLSLAEDGTFTYVPDPGYAGEDSFRYRVDNDHHKGSKATVTLFVEASSNPGTLPTESLPPSEPGAGGGGGSEEQQEQGQQEKPKTCVPNCAEPVLTYSPDYPPLGEYSVEGVCAAIHDDDANTVVLSDGELLEDAVARLAQFSPRGGVIAIPYDVDTVQCDSLKLDEKKHFPDGITIKGIPGPDGEQPRYYCRASDDVKDYNMGGTIPWSAVKSTFFTLSSDVRHNVVIENIHIDGYKGAMKLGTGNTTVIRNSWMHHGPHSGVSSVNTGSKGVFSERIKEYSRSSLEMCGSEISHYGQGNHTHNFYMHRDLGGGGESPKLMAAGAYDSWSEVTIVDNLIHSPGWSSAFKSIANQNNVINNRIYSTLVTDPSFEMEGKHAQMLIDVPSCSRNIIKGNKLFNFKPEKSTGGSAVIGLRGRRTAMRGCDTPFVWTPYSKYSGEDGVPDALYPDDPIHGNEWWEDQNKKIFFPTILKNNKITVSGPYSFRQTAVKIYGTYWIYEGLKKVTCQLPTPAAWYDRSRLYASENTFVGFNPDKIYVTRLSNHHPKCLNQPQPPGPGPSEDIYEIGLGEIYR